MKLYIKLLIFALGIQVVSACASPLSLEFDTGGGPTERALTALFFICIEIFFLFKFTQWLYFKKEAEQAKRNIRRTIYGLFLIPATLLFLLTVQNLQYFLYYSPCIPSGTTTITIPEINFNSTTTRK